MVEPVVALSIAGVFCAIGLASWLHYRNERQRSSAMEQVARQLNLAFTDAEDTRLLDRLQSFPFFNTGRSRKMSNVMTAETEQARLAVFDYRFTTGNGQSSQTHHHTLVVIESELLRLPRFSLRPEKFFDRVRAKFGMQDIDFEDHETFSRLFVLQGENEAEIRQYFDQDLLDLLAAQPEISVDGGADLFTYRETKRQPPEQVAGLMERGYTLYQAFCQRVS